MPSRERPVRPTRAAVEADWGAGSDIQTPRPSGAAEGNAWAAAGAIRRPGRGASSWREHEVSRLAAEQRTLITDAQLIELGIGRGSVKWALARGRLHRVHRRVYSVVAPEARPPLAREQAALLACGGASALSHRSAAAIWGMRVQPGDEVEVIAVGHERGRRQRGVRVHRAALLGPAEVRKRERLLLTSPARTQLDLVSELGTHEFERLFDDAIARGLVSRTALHEVLQRHPGHRGSAALRELVQQTTLSRSSGEKELLKLLRRARLPAPETNARIGHFEVDFLWRNQRVAVELDGYEFHSSRTAQERDRRKDLALQNAGFVVIRVSGRQLAQQPELVLAWIAAALARGEARVA